jgi:hypothetical protein
MRGTQLIMRKDVYDVAAAAERRCEGAAAAERRC